MTNEEINKIVMKSEAEYDSLKDKVHSQYEDIQKLKNIVSSLEKDIKKELSFDRPRDNYNYGLTNAFDYVLYKIEELKKSNGYDKM